VTDLYGVMYKPFDFDANKKYPIIAYVYPGPQTEKRDQDIHAASAERGARSIWLHCDRSRQSRWTSESLKVVSQFRLRQVCGTMGSPIRKLRSSSSRAGIHTSMRTESELYGHSGGGFMSTAAMLVFPDFFKVAVVLVGEP